MHALFWLGVSPDRLFEIYPTQAPQRWSGTHGFSSGTVAAAGLTRLFHITVARGAVDLIMLSATAASKTATETSVGKAEAAEPRAAPWCPAMSVPTPANSVPTGSGAI